MIGPVSNVSSAKWTVQPESFTPESIAAWFSGTPVGDQFAALLGTFTLRPTGYLALAAQAVEQTQQALRCATANKEAMHQVVLDLGALGDRERPASGTSWLRLARAAELAHVGLLVLGSERCNPGSFAGACLVPELVRPQYVGRGRNRRMKGVELTLALTRNKLGVPAGRARLVLDAPLLEPPGRHPLGRPRGMPDRQHHPPGHQ